MVVDAGPPAAEAALARLDEDTRPGIWIERLPAARVRAAAAATADEAVTPGPLAGTTVAVKGNIDVAGLRTTAGCASYGEVAERSAVVVERLERAGALVVGTTNLDQFATGLVGTRAPSGACPNVGWPDLVPGGSSSGSAAAVAAGLVDLALGTDTAGSGRVPAAATGIVGIKPTRGWLPTAGVVPACASLDCVSVFVPATRVGLARGSNAVVAMAGPHPDDPWTRAKPADAPAAPPARVRVGVPVLGTDAFDGEADGLPRFEQAVEDLVAGLEAGGFRVARQAVDLEPFLAAGRLLYEGAFVAERYAAVGPFVAAGGPGLDPIVAEIIAASGRLPAWRLASDRTTLAGLAQEAAATWADVDVVVVPTVPRVPTVAEVEAEPVAVNAMLGTFTNGVNLLDLCALALPVGPPSAERPPPSLTLWAPAWHDDVVLGLGDAYLAR